MKQFAIYLKHLAVNTPAERPLRHVQYLLDRRRRRAVVGLGPIAEEDGWIDEVLAKVLTPNSVCIDVGSHLGTVVGAMGRIVTDGRVHAVEPDPQKAQWLRSKFPQTVVHQAAVGAEPGTADFFVNMKKRGFSGLQKHGPGGEHTSMTVEVKTLDSLLADEARVDFIKIDIEGGELAAFRGAETVLSRHRPTVIFECTQSGMDSFGYNSHDMWNFWDTRQYRLVYLEKFLADSQDAISADDFRQAHVFPFRAYNYVAVPHNGS